MLLLLTSEMLGLFANTLTVYDKYSRHNCEIFWQQIEMQLSEKSNNFPQFLIAFLKSTSNFEYLEKKVSLIA